MSWIEEWQRANNASLVRDSGTSPGWVLPIDPVAELAAQQATTAANNAQWGIGTSVAATSPVAPVVQAPTTPAGATDVQKSARALIQSTLEQYGLGGLGDRLWQQYLAGAPIEQIFMDLRSTSEYKTRFAGMAALQEKGRAISEAEYIATERSYAQVARAAGLPSGFYDSPDDFARLIGGDVSPAEYADRVRAYSHIAMEAPPEVRSELQRLYGIGDGDLVAFFIDEKRALPLLQQKARAAELSGAATRSGFGGLAVGEAERLAQLGVTDQQAQEGFGALVDARELFTPLDSGEDVIGRDAQIGGALGGDAQARRRIEDRRRRRTAQFEGGGGYAGNKQGLSGIGSAS